MADDLSTIMDMELEDYCEYLLSSCKGYEALICATRYYVYRSVVALATHYYRPQQGNEEYEARRILTWALNQLAAI
jgi:hypothetical protein